MLGKTKSLQYTCSFIIVKRLTRGYPVQTDLAEKYWVSITHPVPLENGRCHGPSDFGGAECGLHVLTRDVAVPA